MQYLIWSAFCIAGIAIGMVYAYFRIKRRLRPPPAPPSVPVSISTRMRSLEEALADLQHAHGILHNRFQKLSGSFYGTRKAKGLGDGGDGWDGQMDFVGRLTSDQIVERAKRQGVVP